MGAWQITKKDVSQLVRDRRALAVLVAFPLVFITLIGFSAERLLSWRDDSQRISVTIVNRETGQLGQMVIAGLKANETLAVRIVAEPPKDGGRSDEAGPVVTFAPGFESRLMKLASLENLNRGNSAEAREPRQADIDEHLKSLHVTVQEKTKSGAAGAIVREAVLEQITLALVERISPADSAVARLLGTMRATRKPSRMDSLPKESAGEPADGRQSKSSGVYQELVPSYTVLFAFFLVNIMARSFLGERDLGTLRRLRLAPLSPPSLLVGKTAPFLILSIGQSFLLFLCGKLLFGMSWGPAAWMLLPVICCTSMAATSVGLLLATLVRTDSQVSAYANFLVLAMAGVSGCFVPRDWLPETMQRISLITPQAWSLIAYNQLLGSPQVNGLVVGQCCLVLMAFSASLFVLGWYGFRRLA